MSQCRSDLHILLNFSIYIFPRYLYWNRLDAWKCKFFHWPPYYFQCQKLLKNRKCPNPLMFLQGVKTRILAEGSNEVNEVKTSSEWHNVMCNIKGYKGWKNKLFSWWSGCFDLGLNIIHEWKRHTWILDFVSSSFAFLSALTDWFPGSFL